MVFLILEQMSEKERIAALYRELSIANHKLAEANKQLEEYTEELVSAAETRERNRFAQEIHDTLGHALTGIVTGIEACIMLMDIAPDAIYRIVQESVTNAIRHGKADVIDIGIGREDGLLNIKIKDNGIGCGKVYKGFGLHHMQERLSLLKGTLSYDGSDGFSIDASIPIRWGNSAEEKED